jgi:hypothetical protein
VYNRESMQLVTCDLNTLQKSKKKKKKRKRSSSKDHVQQKQTTHGEDKTSVTRKFTTLGIKTFSCKARLNSPVGLLQERTLLERDSRKISFSVYHSKQALVKSLVEKYLRNRKLKFMRNGSSILPGHRFINESEQVVCTNIVKKYGFFFLYYY